ncbi:hypothetical protein [Micromonospora sp. CB01531]|uniref:hypothetical protein n=1 Tax=Micromonospora sp. CB01531 TaxID=1718947 RepID=UPI00093AAD53|nr:hypothetical protein [Micromonospora sp. CB01531]OKI85933.1 hypothetical protein A6A27_40040 [Micromonospora sp. CB01531]
MDGANSDLEGSPSERELQVLHLFMTKRRELPLLAASRCPHDERLLAAVFRLTDGLWAWHAGSRLSPSGSRTEIESWHLDRFDSEEFSPEIYREAAQLADELLSAAPRYESPATVVRILSCGGDRTVRVTSWRGTRHALQFFANGLPLFEYTSCKCRRAYHVQMLALVHAGVRADAGTIRRGSHVQTLPVTPAGKSAGVAALAYQFTGRGVQVTLDER